MTLASVQADVVQEAGSADIRGLGPSAGAASDHRDETPLGTAPTLVTEQSRGWAESIPFFFQYICRSGHYSSHTGNTDRNS